VAQTPIRDSKTRATRARIGKAALELFTTQGYAETTIDQIADAAGVGRRTVFRHFATKEAMIFDHFVYRREVAIQRLRERPPAEPPLASLHAILREMCEEGFDRRVLAQIRSILTAEPQLAKEDLSLTSRVFTRQLLETLQARVGDSVTSLEIHTITLLATGWLVTAAHFYLIERRRSLVKCYDEVVDASLRAAAAGVK
jgi:AcrR family transcriptional regulator